MKIWVTQPNLGNSETGLNDSPLSPRFITTWEKAASQTASLCFIKNRPHQTHGALLTEIWQQIVDDPDPLHVISELDFIPYDTFVSEMSYCLSDMAASFVPYCIRESDLQLRDLWPLSGAWLIGINKELMSRLGFEPPLTWLGAAGPYNDAANMAAPLMLGSPLITSSDLFCCYHTDDAPNSLALEYSGFGTHCFFHRHFTDSPETELFPGYSLGRHLEDIDNKLKALEE